MEQRIHGSMTAGEGSRKGMCCRLWRPRASSFEHRVGSLFLAGKEDESRCIKLEPENKKNKRMGLRSMSEATILQWLFWRTKKKRKKRGGDGR